jgi:hypothetical protein
MNANDKITLVHADDWVGLYKNGELLCEGHSFSPYHIFEALEIDVDYIEADNEWMDKVGNLPQDIKDVKKEIPF